ncbi:claudin-7 [Oreochromis niloticus]|uniref:Claudin n=1 Tax=Oreochromis aureus TaxID=47969 RepID=A0A668S7V3_OREAU|nr:claudin-7 [Oreochromis niloticus]XP_031600981.1 claudin-7-like [Oreochromis aureus]
MAASGLQLLGFFLSLVGVAATAAATVMVDWKKLVQGKHRSYEGLWMSCGGVQDRATCEIYHSFIKLPDEIQATRIALPLSLFLSALAMLVSTVGMKCTHFMDGASQSKSVTAMIGGIMFMLSGLLTIIITSWFVKVVLQNFYDSPPLIRSEFGNAVFVSWAGGLLTLTGGAFLSCRRCATTSSMSISSSRLLPTSDPKSNYV